MTLQRQPFGHCRPVAPRRIPFVLSGRTTLSEHLPAEIIDVPITVAQCSSYLRNAVARQALNDLTERPIRLPDVDPTGFRMYIDWLKVGRVEFHIPTSTNTGAGLLLRDSFDLIFAHMAGSQLEEPDFQDYIIDELSKLLDASQTPDLKVLEVVFLEKGASNILKQFVIDRMFAVERRMLSMMRGFVGSTKAIRGCEYHVHEARECYRHRTVAKFESSHSLPNNSNDGFNARELSVYNGSERFQASTPTLPYKTTSANAPFYKMADAAYFGSAEWSREVRGFGRHSLMQNLRTDKPLPVIPPLTPGTSPSPPSSPCSLISSLSNNKTAYQSTQQLISECLARLPHLPTPSILASDPDPHASAVPVLIMECLERFKRNNTKRASSSESEDSPPQHLRQRYASPDISIPVKRPILQARSQKHVRWQPSFEELPKPARKELRAEFPVRQRSFSTRPASTSSSTRPNTSPHSPSIPHSPASPTLSIPRKPAPHRGSDWLTQYNLINTLSTTPKASMIAAKPSKKSRFVEMLRSDSGLSRRRVGMGSGMELEREGSVIRIKSAMD
ncbi:hypothetical protein HBI22_147120 [Parastagonospora nodorum]|nr:hypothetical protein HBI28_141580 [Parastagonospora nodorum]KAH5626833.1 hypothetical protein HBI22_147120 [Parastagonospora nodorum]KAH5674361.1 hypothetical protein HBI21_139390 [Parastagonospora nodorum]